ncbi:MAG: hypothetical protein DMF09_05520 [Verrucomicrobia bacterium]|nr:MAG: hypothetical protein DMF09_05520 [Verrucomicrobiota bacterium]
MQVWVCAKNKDEIKVASKHLTFKLARISDSKSCRRSKRSFVSEKRQYERRTHTISGSIPAAYDRYLGPMLFQPYAADLAARLQVAKNGSVLELACDTGILTRVLRTRLPSTVKLTAD